MSISILDGVDAKIACLRKLIKELAHIICNEFTVQMVKDETCKFTHLNGDREELERTLAQHIEPELEAKDCDQLTDITLLAVQQFSKAGDRNFNFLPEDLTSEDPARDRRKQILNTFIAFFSAPN